MLRIVCIQSRCASELKLMCDLDQLDVVVYYVIGASIVEISRVVGRSEGLQGCVVRNIDCTGLQKLFLPEQHQHSSECCVFSVVLSYPLIILCSSAVFYCLSIARALYERVAINSSHLPDSRASLSPSEASLATRLIPFIMFILVVLE